VKTVVHKADSRGKVNLGWLLSFQTFSFSNYYNPECVHFGALRVLNDDFIAPARSFGTHPHDNMETVTVMLGGALRHEDSMGNKYVINAGEVQRMSAGTGITHSEASSEVPIKATQDADLLFVEVPM
jgi:redox-sensitive bicupin YhaK (pirin superfamily)